MSTTSQDLPVPPRPTTARLRLQADGTWWWSDACFLLHGFAVGEVVPTTELVLAHVHPEDRDTWWETLRSASGDGAHAIVRLRDAAGRPLQVVGVARRTDDAAVDVLLVDLTRVVAAEGGRLATEQITAAAASRATIEQATGVAAAAYGLDVDAAFTLLRTASMHRNVNLRAIAQQVVDHVAARGGATVEPLAGDVALLLGKARPQQARRDPP
ncbi:PAS and ANTAR domain-containing protein [Cellulomonas sp. S1-8]|uniref:PAS and ANTAR domain-containing protein n=1 Tax=Cellulomonas sp. S1-8 TaxID=2904790 RepID=UPI0022430E61|nr:PAS and ANTAR domain-containing protein [Cellulomonas sp. S1-8]UZN03919.1 PAS and ANTAR domain-containing protein [Cellulomonas sp. S1-8]